MFLDFFGGRAFPISRLKSFRRLRDGKIECTLDNDDILVFDHSTFDGAITRTIQATLPAAPGTKLLVTDVDENGNVVGIIGRAVIGFAFDAAGIAHPVTIDGMPEDNPVIEHPDGSVEQFDLGAWPDRANYLAELQSRQ